jgi:V/A-type H+/Na+-transporting ATPase subunit F
MKFYCIADEDTVRGFNLAGVAGQVATLPQETNAAIQQILNREDIGVIILTQSLADGIREQVEALRLERDHPLIVEIPGPEGSIPGRRSLQGYVQEAVGIRLETGEGN